MHPNFMATRYRECVAGDAIMSSLSLKQTLSNGQVRYMTIKRVRYGRAVAVVTAGELSLSHWQLWRREAQSITKWDDGQRIAHAC